MCFNGGSDPTDLDAGAPRDAGYTVAGCPPLPGHLRVTVLYQQGGTLHPVDDAEVELRGPDGRVERTGPAGQVDFRDLTPGDGYTVVATNQCTSDGRENTSVTSDTTTPVNVLVNPLGTLRGRVTDADNNDAATNGISGATVTLVGVSGRPAATTNAQGAYEFTFVAPDRYQIRANKAGHTTSTVVATPDFAPCGTIDVAVPIRRIVLEIVNRTTGAVITGVNQTRIIGEKVKLEVRTRPAGEAMTDISWSIPGNRIKDYTQAVGAATKTALPAADLRRNRIDYYWIQRGSHTVQVSAQVAGAPLTASAPFDILAPTGVSFTGEQCPTVLGPHFLFTLGVNAYDAGSGHFGIQWNATCTAPAGGDGRIAITQLITRNFSRTRAGVAEHITSPAQVLDDGLGIQYSGSQPITAGAAATLSGAPYADSPGSGPPALTADITAINCSDQFTDFFMYQSSLPDSIWVTLSRLTWSWSGAATAAPPPPPPPPPSGFILGAHSPAAVTTQTGAASSTLPEWTVNLAPSNHWTT